MRREFHSGSVKKSITVRVPTKAVWRSLSNIAGLPEWVIGVRECRFKTEIRRGVGAVRDLVFADGNRVEEHVVSWHSGESFSYIAVSGLPLRGYVATISLKRRGSDSTIVTWQSYMNSQRMTGRQFAQFLAFMGAFYEGSLENLKVQLEKKRIKA